MPHLRKSSHYLTKIINKLLTMHKLWEFIPEKRSNLKTTTQLRWRTDKDSWRRLASMDSTWVRRKEILRMPIQNSFLLTIFYPVKIKTTCSKTNKKLWIQILIVELILNQSSKCQSRINVIRIRWGQLYQIVKIN